MSQMQQERECCTICDAKKFCHICKSQTLYACSDCRIDFGVTIYVCTSKACRDEHEERYCPSRLRESGSRPSQAEALNELERAALDAACAWVDEFGILTPITVVERKFIATVHVLRKARAADKEKL